MKIPDCCLGKKLCHACRPRICRRRPLSRVCPNLTKFGQTLGTLGGMGVLDYVSQRQTLVGGYCTKCLLCSQVGISLPKQFGVEKVSPSKKSFENHISGIGTLSWRALKSWRALYDVDPGKVQIFICIILRSHLNRTKTHENSAF